MCGFNGFTFRDPATLRRMHALTHHRGPDDEGFFEDDNLSLAHNRLSIIDLSPAGRQPMSTPDGRFTLVFNGEIYNYRELRQVLEMQGEVFTTQTDTEVLLRILAREGKTGLKKVNGIFACAFWDTKEKRLLLIRDPMGVKPLYYREEEGRLWFSSELKALVRVGRGKPDIDQVALGLYLRLLYVPAPRTMLRGIYKLPAGHVLEWQHGRLTVEAWTEQREGIAPTSYEEAQERVRELTQAAVTRQLVSERPVGVFLSGGLDSSILLAAMRQTVPGPIETYTVSYTSPVDAQKYNADAELARLTADYFHTTHHEVLVTPADVEACFDKVVWHMDEPIANHVQPATYLLAQAAQQKITVALGGDGGDELFGGYARYWYQAKIERLRRLGVVLPARLVAALAPKSKWGYYASLVAQSLGTDRHLAFLLQKEQAVARVLRTPFAPVRSALEEVFDPLFAHPWRDPVNQSMAADLPTWLAEESLMRTDKMTMAHGLEERVPFLDLELVAFAASIPSAWKVDTREQGKRIFVDAWRNQLPAHVVTQEKRAFMSPAAKWIREPLYTFMHERLAPHPASALDALVDFSAAQTLFTEHVEKKQYHLHILWALMTLRVWHEQYLSD
ncbi:asparagine synthase (glutamine-hydrolyzing) [Patescibacteria group bacterium]|nr:asparagine synthase (glutamine-hydrolyzing) [Patescibacteria group bacterium]MBP9709695.1 asparagine synthase (glutamine-hydrolyzing) [Patescibacteria group bacterium]